jgi:hypothetical protein
MSIKRVLRITMAGSLLTLGMLTCSFAAFDCHKAVDEIATDPLTAYSTVYLGMPRGDFDADFSVLPDWVFYKNNNNVNEKVERKGIVNGVNIVEGLAITSVDATATSKVIAFDNYFKTGDKKTAWSIYKRIMSTVWSGMEDMPIAQDNDHVAWKVRDITVVVSIQYNRDESQYVIIIRRYNNVLLDK